MHFVTETPDIKQHVLIVTQGHTQFVSELKTFLVRYGYTIYISPHIPPQYGHFQHIFYLTAHHRIPSALSMLDIPVTAIVFFAHISHIPRRSPSVPATMKIVHIVGNPNIPAESFEKIIWFTFGTNTEHVLTIHHSIPTPSQPQQPDIPKRNVIAAQVISLIRPRTVIVFLLSCFIIAHILFVFPLAFAYIQLWQSVTLLKNKQWDAATQKAQDAQQTLQSSQSLYAIVRPTYLITTLSRYPDTAFQLHTATGSFVMNAAELYDESKTFVHLLFATDKTKQDIDHIDGLIDQISTHMSSMQQQATTIQQQLPSLNGVLEHQQQQIKQFNDFAGPVRQLLPELRVILAKGTEKTYVLFFANNMELRPGGGFIGSFAVVHVHNYTIDPIKTYDVYDADGQLTAHIDPPAPIAKYLNQPHWFLRDSAFSPDYPRNAQEARFFLDKTMNLHTIDGTVLITTTAVQNILEMTGPIEIPDYQETITKDNFYIKAQIYAEKNFFPGSIKKKQFLAAVFDQLLLTLEDFSRPQTLLAIKTSLDAKQIVADSNDTEVQTFLDNQYWSGRMLPATCPPSQSSCLPDYVFPVEANLGVNKANFYMKRSYDSDIEVGRTGTVRHKFTTTFINGSFRDVFPGGTYKNYYQIYLPPDSVINRITRDDVLVDQFDEETTDYKRIGVYLEIKPQTQTRLTIDYTLAHAIPKGKSVYQIIVQKQIGLSNTDSHWTIHLPQNIYITNQNVTPLVKDNTISYNHSLASDTIFYFEVLRE